MTAGTKVQPHRRRYSRATCGGRFDDLAGTALAGHDQPLRVRALCPYLMGLNLPDRRIARGLDPAASDVRAVRFKIGRAHV